MSWARIRHGTSVIKGMCEPKAKARPTVCTPSSEAALMMRRTPSQTTSMPESHGDGDLLGTVAVAVEAGLADQHLKAATQVGVGVFSRAPRQALLPLARPSCSFSSDVEPDWS